MPKSPRCSQNPKWRDCVSGTLGRFSDITSEACCFPGSGSQCFRYVFDTPTSSSSMEFEPDISSPQEHRFGGPRGNVIPCLRIPPERTPFHQSVGNGIWVSARHCAQHQWCCVTVHSLSTADLLQLGFLVKTPNILVQS